MTVKPITLPRLDGAWIPCRTREAMRRVRNEVLARIMAASLSPSARIGLVAAIMFSVHTVKRRAAEDTQTGCFRSLQTTHKDVLAVIILRSVGNGPKFNSRHLILLNQKA